ncbi:MAG: hypothetical protein WAO58_11785 [Fimbriimonadaceae bacterium]
MSRRYTNTHVYYDHANWPQVLADLTELGLAGARWQVPLEAYADSPGVYHYYAQESVYQSANDLASEGFGTIFLCAYGPRPDQAAWKLIADDDDTWEVAYANAWNSNPAQAYPPSGSSNDLWQAMADLFIDQIGLIRQGYTDASLDPDQYVTIGWWNEPGVGWDLNTDEYSFHAMSNFIAPQMKGAMGGSVFASPTLNGDLEGEDMIAETNLTISYLDTILSSGQAHLDEYDRFAVNMYMPLQNTFGADEREAFLSFQYKAFKVLEKITADYGKPVQIHEFGFSADRAGMAKTGRRIDHRRRGRMIRGAMAALETMPFDLICQYVLHQGTTTDDSDPTGMSGLCRSDTSRYAAFQELGYHLGKNIAGSFIESD